MGNLRIIYETTGLAREYCELAANLYSGCSHGCSYCYAPGTTYRSKADFKNNVRVRRDALRKFAKDAEELYKRGETRPVLLSFTTDPYQPLDVSEQVTRQAIKILFSYNLKCEILTKGGKRSERDFDILAEHPDLCSYGATLVFTEGGMQRKIEPGAASTFERITVLEKAHNLGIPTFVSLEPVWKPEQTLALVDLTHNFVDLYKVGMLNHHPHKNNIDWGNFKTDVVQKFEQYKCKYYLKKSLEAL